MLKEVAEAIEETKTIHQRGSRRKQSDTKHSAISIYKAVKISAHSIVFARSSRSSLSEQKGAAPSGGKRLLPRSEVGNEKRPHRAEESMKKLTDYAACAG